MNKTTSSFLENYGHLLSLGVLSAIGAYLWHMAPPEGLTPQAWHMFVLFVGTIVGIILKPLPMGGIALLALAIGTLTDTFTAKQCFSGFGDKIVWLVAFAFFLALGFTKTGLGTRIAYFFTALLGRSTLGLAYGLAFTDFLLAPGIPSTTARGAAIILPVAKALSIQQGSLPDDGTARRLGAFLIKVCFQVNTLTCALFLTAIVCNPFIARFAAAEGIQLDWVTWATATIVPGLVNLLLLPWFIFKIYPPELKHPENAVELAKSQLKAMGPFSRNEWLMLGVFLSMLFLWIGGDYLGIDATAAALAGVVGLLVLKVISWDDILREKGAWDTVLWFGPLVMMAGLLSDFGLISWFSQKMQAGVSGLSWEMAFIALGLVYFLVHYFFASVTAHVNALYAAFLGTLLAFGAPPMLTAISLAVLSSLSGALTHYGTSPAPAFYGAGYISIQKWWSLSLIISIFNLCIWSVVGGAWWKFLGYW
jgi:DASS family divalent anion:Na+ symporter